MDAILERRELLGADRPARVEFAGGDSDLGAKAELAAIGKLRRGIVQHDRGIDLAEELRRGGRILGDDRIGVVRAVVVDMCDRRIDAVNHDIGWNHIE